LSRKKSQRKSDIAGATNTVKADELVKRPIMRLEQAFPGTTPGVSVVSSTKIYSGGVAASTDVQLQAFKANGGTDWQNALIQNYQVDLSGGSSAITYRISYNYLDQPGLILNKWYKKSTFRTNFDIKASDKLNLKFNLSAMLPSSRNNGYQGDLTDPFSQANIWDPTSPFRDPQTGTYIRNSTYGSVGFKSGSQWSVIEVKPKK